MKSSIYSIPQNQNQRPSPLTVSSFQPQLFLDRSLIDTECVIVVDRSMFSGLCPPNRFQWRWNDIMSGLYIQWCVLPQKNAIKCWLAATSRCVSTLTRSSSSTAAVAIVYGLNFAYVAVEPWLEPACYHSLLLSLFLLLLSSSFFFSSISSLANGFLTSWYHLKRIKTLRDSRWLRQWWWWWWKSATCNARQQHIWIKRPK